MSEKSSSIQLNYPTIVGGAVAAATAAALATRLGLVGTILGAALASVVSTIVTASIASWIERMHHATRRRDPLPFRGLLIGALSMALVGYAFHTGLSLVTRDLPNDAFAARWLSLVGLS